MKPKYPKHRKAQRARAHLRAAQSRRASAGQAVTDHAVVRWLERVEGLDLSRIRRQLMGSPAVQSALLLSGRNQVRVRDHQLGLDIIVREGAVVTVYIPDEVAAKADDHG